MFLRLLFFLYLTASVSGYIFKCIGKCECDTDVETIHCHNDGDRQRLELPEKRLRGYSYIGITHNDIRVLPSEELLLEKFPDLQAIDIEQNANFDCSTLDHYKKIQILSDCGKNPDEIENINVYDIMPATNDCDYKCQVKRHYDSLSAYVRRLLKVLQEKFDNLNNTKFVTDIRNWFSELIADLKSEKSD
ncbi:hypothetical protein FO519_000604 [Halicephalobus sp. NKZ332]|nr:hypothetical protein FO519_000604 [Halicephalobus sp. NKZ332]